MATVLDPKSFQSNKNVNLQTVSNNKTRRVVRVQSDLNRVYTEAETNSRAVYLGFPYVDLYGFPIDTNHLIFIPYSRSKELKMGIFSIRNKELYIATCEPGHTGQKEFIQDLKMQGWLPKIHLCSEISFDKILHTYSFVIETKEIHDGINLTEESFNKSNKENDIRRLGEKLGKASMSEIVELILGSALEGRASDIHFEPEKESYNIRLRIDGILHTVVSLAFDMIKPIESRLKILAGLKLNVDNVPQDGRFSFKDKEKEIDVRVSMLPSNYGYSIVMRLLGTGQVSLELESLGFIGLSSQRVMAAINKPQGMILTTGPTGSGKTTTLYTFLSHLNDGQSKIITLEDPVEYKLKGVSQTQIDTKAGYTFGSGLRSILRQDPDVVMVGEIRDAETAEVAIQASLTGHQVLSTIHTNDAAGAIPRLIEMDVQGFILADSLSAVIGQRLVRRLCNYCKHKVDPSAEEMVRVEEELSKISPQAKAEIPQDSTFYTAEGCDKCSGLGYKGRIGVYEVLTMTDGLRTLLSKEIISILDVRQVAQREGMLTMLQDGIIKAMQGHTDLKELFSNIA
jgi:type II secretory ATPase GspE/PulE/Tfp pilus assembly ATPase PilB-like protein